MTAIRTVILSASVLALAACGPSVEGPGENDIAEFLEMELPEGVDVENIEIVAAQNVGDEIEPVYRTRTKITLELEEDYAERVDTIGDRPVVKVVAEAGTEYEGILFTRGEPIGDSDWSVEQERLQIRSMKGRPLSSFDNYVIEGSAEEKTAREEAKREEAAAEKRAAEELTAARKSFTGNWTASQPLTRNGSVYSSRGQQIGISFNLGANEDGFGKGTATLFDFGNPAISAQVPVNYVVDGSGRFAQVTFLERAAHDDIRTSIGSGTVYRLNPDGSANNGRWGIKLKK